MINREKKKIFEFLFQENELSNKDMINLHFYFFLTKNTDKMKITSFELSVSSNLIRLSYYNIIYNSFQEISKANIEKKT